MEYPAIEIAFDVCKKERHHAAVRSRTKIGRANR